MRSIYPALLAWGLLVSAAPAFVANPDFTDADGDGRPEGWEIKTYILENMRGVPCLSMKFPRHNDRSLEGEAAMVFEGPAGFYRVTVRYLDEFDGVSKAKLLVNGETVHIWSFDGTFGDCWRDEVIENVELAPGNKVALLVRDNPSEYGRIRSFNIEPSPVPPTAEELAERRTPPVIEDKEFGPLVPLRDHRDLAAYLRRPEYRPLLAGRGSPLLVLQPGGEAAVLDLEIERPKNPLYAVHYHGGGATGRGEPLESGEEAPLPYDEQNATARIDEPFSRPGLYEVSVPKTYVRGSVPHVLAAQAGPEDKGRGGAQGGFYFFVPKGTKAFGVGAYSPGDRRAEVAVYAPDGSLVTRQEVPKEADRGIPIRVRPGQDDAVWVLNVTGISPVIRLCGVPPYLATHPRHLLVPAECVAARQP